MANTKYEITDEQKVLGRFVRTYLRRIRALRDIGTDVKAGQLGGWIEEEINLATFGESWIYDNAACYNHGRVSMNARLRDTATCIGGTITGNAEARGTAKISHARMEDDAVARDDAQVSGWALIYANGVVGGTRHVRNNAKVGRDEVVD